MSVPISAHCYVLALPTHTEGWLPNPPQCVRSTTGWTHDEMLMSAVADDVKVALIVDVTPLTANPAQPAVSDTFLKLELTTSELVAFVQTAPTIVCAGIVSLQVGPHLTVMLVIDKLTLNEPPPRLVPPMPCHDPAATTGVPAVEVPRIVQVQPLIVTDGAVIRDVPEPTAPLSTVPE